MHKKMRATVQPGMFAEVTVTDDLSLQYYSLTTCQEKSKYGDPAATDSYKKEESCSMLCRIAQVSRSNLCSGPVHRCRAASGSCHTDFVSNVLASIFGTAALPWAGSIRGQAVFGCTSAEPTTHASAATPASGVTCTKTRAQTVSCCARIQIYALCSVNLQRRYPKTPCKVAI